jgi:hypothetical protein
MFFLNYKFGLIRKRHHTAIIGSKSVKKLPSALRSRFLLKSFPLFLQGKYNGVMLFCLLSNTFWQLHIAHGEI